MQCTSFAEGHFGETSKVAIHTHKHMTSAYIMVRMMYVVALMMHDVGTHEWAYDIVTAKNCACFSLIISL